MARLWWDFWGYFDTSDILRVVFNNLNLFGRFHDQNIPVLGKLLVNESMTPIRFHCLGQEDVYSERPHFLANSAKFFINLRRGPRSCQSSYKPRKQPGGCTHLQFTWLETYTRFCPSCSQRYIKRVDPYLNDSCIDENREGHEIHSNIYSEKYHVNYSCQVGSCYFRSL